MRFLGSVKTIIFSILIGILLYSCNAGTSSDKVPTTAHILLSNVKTHIFSSHSKEDTFKLVLTGDSLDNSSAIFTIMSYKGKRIYADTFPSGFLYSNQDSIIPPLKQAESFVRSFFEDSLFSKPKSDDKFVNINNRNFTERAEKKYDTTVIEFKYATNVERRLIYSKKQQKVLIFMSKDDLNETD
jgi:hypothetical protein